VLPTRAAFRFALSYYMTNGLVGAVGLLLISSGVQFFLDPFAASAASVGAIVVIPPDQAAPRRGKLRQLLPAAVIGPPLFFAVHALHQHPLYLGLLLVPGTFLAFLAGAWGKRGLPIVVSGMFAMVFSLAVPERAGEVTALSSTLYFTLGAALYLVWATLANAALNERYRVQMLADTLLALAGLVRTEGEQLAVSTPGRRENRVPLIGVLLQQQAALADHIQAARNILLEAPRTPRRQRLAAMLVQTIEMRDHLLAGELDLDILKSGADPDPVLSDLREVFGELAAALERLADDLLWARYPAPFVSRRPRLQALRWSERETAPAEGSAGPAPATLARGLADRVGHVNDEVVRLVALARGDSEPDVALVRSAWRMFVSPTTWSWRPLMALWRWDAPPLRHAIRASMAIGTAYAASLALPWGSHDYWILLTIVVVLRGSLAQTLERRNSRVAGTLLGCVLVAGLLLLHPPLSVLMITVTLAQAVAHAFATKRYLVTAVAATILGLVQAHLLSADSSPVFDLAERMADTILGGAIAWAFSYVVPSWERTQIPALVRRAMEAQARHTVVALALGRMQAGDPQPELTWRLARREAYDSLSALVQATQRSLFEPRAVRPPLRPLARMLAHSYQLLAHLTAVKTMLLMRREDLDVDVIATPLQETAGAIEAALSIGPGSTASGARSAEGPQAPAALPDPFDGNLNPWMLRRLRLAAGTATQLRGDAERVLRETAT